MPKGPVFIKLRARFKPGARVSSPAASSKPRIVSVTVKLNVDDLIKSRDLALDHLINAFLDISIKLRRIRASNRSQAKSHP